MTLRNAKYLTRYKDDVIIFVSPTKLLDRLESDSVSFSIRGGKNQIGNRVQRAKEYILKNWNNPDAKKNFKNWLYQIFQPSVCGIYNGALSFSDGRHRVLAAEELGIPEVAIEVPKNQEKLFDYMKVNNLDENCDRINYDIYSLHYPDDDALPFISNSDGSIVEIGLYGATHGSVAKVEKKNDKDNYWGRMWMNNKVMSFWTYPNREIFDKIINELEIKTDRTIWNDGWKIEIILIDNEIPIDNAFVWQRYNDPKKEIIPIEDYLSSENFPDELRQYHLMTSREKEELRKSGKDPMRYWKTLGKQYPLAYKQAIYQEKKMITKFEDFEMNF